MQFSSNWRLGGDYQSNLCMTVFRKHVVRLNKEEGFKGGTAATAGAGVGAVNTTEPPGRHNKKSWDKFVWPVLSVTTVSDLGLERERSYSNPRQLAQALIEALPEEGAARLLADAQVPYSSTPPLPHSVLHEYVPLLNLPYSSGEWQTRPSDSHHLRPSGMAPHNGAPPVWAVRYLHQGCPRTAHAPDGEPRTRIRTR
jgi:hypothetical protein